MARPVTLFTGQWADLTLEVLPPKASEWGYDGIELRLLGRPLRRRSSALAEPTTTPAGSCDLLAEYGLKCWAIANHLVGQVVLDPIDERHRRLGCPPRSGATATRRRAASAPPRR